MNSGMEVEKMHPCSKLKMKDHVNENNGRNMIHDKLRITNSGSNMFQSENKMKIIKAEIRGEKYNFKRPFLISNLTQSVPFYGIIE